MPQTNAPSKQQSAVPGRFGQGALDALGGFWLPAAVVVLVLLGGAAYLRWPLRRRGTTAWATPAAEFPVEPPAPAPPPAAGAPVREEHPVLVPQEPFAESTVPPLVPTAATSTPPAAATNGAGGMALRSAARPTAARPARLRPRHRPELKVHHHHHQASGPPGAGPRHSPKAALRQFVEDWSGVPLETDGGPPSMALLRAYAGQVLGAPPVWGLPVDIPDTYDMDHYVWVRESPYRVPAPGDAVVWAPRPEDAHDGGHIAIFLRGDASGFDAFEAAGSAPTVRHHADYLDVIGWLHPVGG